MKRYDYCNVTLIKKLAVLYKMILRIISSDQSLARCLVLGDLLLLFKLEIKLRNVLNKPISTSSVFIIYLRKNIDLPTRKGWRGSKILIWHYTQF